MLNSFDPVYFCRELRVPHLGCVFKDGSNESNV
jgi:hypothetical protein